MKIGPDYLLRKSLIVELGDRKTFLGYFLEEIWGCSGLGEIHRESMAKKSFTVEKVARNKMLSTYWKKCVFLVRLRWMSTDAYFLFIEAWRRCPYCMRAHGLETTVACQWHTSDTRCCGILWWSTFSYSSLPNYSMPLLWCSRDFLQWLIYLQATCEVVQGAYVQAR